MLIWQEREYKGVDLATLVHPPSIHALKACGLYKFWAIPSMRAQVDFLQWLVDRWNIQDQCFIIDGHQLEIELEDIYFLIGFPKRGERLSLFRTRPGGQSIDSLQLEFCNDQTKDKGIDIKTISHPELKVISFIVTKLCGSTTLHVATRSKIQMAAECYRGTIFNWCEAVLANVKSELNRARNEQLKNFRYGFLVVSFGLERVPMLVPQQLSVGVGLPREPKLVRWVTVMARHPQEGSEVVRFALEYFCWLENQLFVIQDFFYTGMDYHGDPDMILPPRE